MISRIENAAPVPEVLDFLAAVDMPKRVVEARMYARHAAKALRTDRAGGRLAGWNSWQFAANNKILAAYDPAKVIPLGGDR